MPHLQKQPTVTDTPVSAPFECPKECLLSFHAMVCAKKKSIKTWQIQSFVGAHNERQIHTMLSSSVGDYRSVLSDSAFMGSINLGSVNESTIKNKIHL